MGFQLAFLDQVAADRLVGVAVVVGKAQPYEAAVGQLDAAGTLDLQEDGLDRVIDPDQGFGRAGAFAGSNVGCGVIGHQPAAVTPAALQRAGAADGL